MIVVEKRSCPALPPGQQPPVQRDGEWCVGLRQKQQSTVRGVHCLKKGDTFPNDLDFSAFHLEARLLTQTMWRDAQ